MTTKKKTTKKPSSLDLQSRSDSHESEQYSDVNEKELFDIADEIGCSSLEVGINLGLSNKDIKRIEEKYPNDSKRMCFEVMQEWKGRQPNDTDIRHNLSEGLRKAKQVSLADRVDSGRFDLERFQLDSGIDHEDIEISKMYKNLQDISQDYTNFESDELRMVFIGRTGEGKSDTCNSVVCSPQRKTFARSISCRSKTKVSQLVRATVGVLDRPILIVDTPGFFDTELGDEVHAEILRCVVMLDPGPHVIVNVIEIGRQTNEVIATVRKLTDTFGEKCTEHMVFVFTHKDKFKLDPDIKDIDEFVKEMKDDVQTLLRKCKHRYVAFDNTLDPESQENQIQVRLLFEKINEMLKENGHAYFSNEDLEGAKQSLNKRRINKEREVNWKLGKLKSQFIGIVNKAKETNTQLEKLTKDEEKERLNREKIEQKFEKQREELKKIMEERNKKASEIKNLKEERNKQKSKNVELDRKIQETSKKLNKLNERYDKAVVDKKRVEEQRDKMTSEKELAERRRQECEEALEEVEEEKDKLMQDIVTVVETRAKVQIDYTEVVEELIREKERGILNKILEKLTKNACIVM